MLALIKLCYKFDPVYDYFNDKKMSVKFKNKIHLHSLNQTPFINICSI